LQTLFGLFVNDGEKSYIILSQELEARTGETNSFCRQNLREVSQRKAACRKRYLVRIIPLIVLIL
jgi:hypothetical protein